MTAHGLQAYDVQGCEMCGLCASACCTGALTVAGKMMDTDAVMSEVLRDASLYAESGGGMTLSGGEPLFQGDFTLSLLQAAKTKGIHTCLETCGYASPRLMQAVAVHTDLFYYDYKATGEAMHQKLTGVSQERILENLALLDRLEAEVVLRCPIIPGVNDTEAHIEGIGRTARRHTCIREVHLEPYHHLGVSKAVKLGVEVMCESTPPAPDVMEDYRCRVTEAAQKPCKIS